MSRYISVCACARVLGAVSKCVFACVRVGEWESKSRSECKRGCECGGKVCVRVGVTVNVSVSVSVGVRVSVSKSKSESSIVRVIVSESERARE